MSSKFDRAVAVIAAAAAKIPPADQPTMLGYALSRVVEQFPAAADIAVQAMVTHTVAAAASGEPAEVLLRMDVAEAERLDQLLAEADAACEAFKRARHDADERREAVLDQEFVAKLRGQIAEQGSRCKWCGHHHQAVPDDLCDMARIEYDAAEQFAGELGLAS